MFWYGMVCRKYKSVMIGKDHKDFLDKLEIAVEKMNDKGSEKYGKSFRCS